MKTKKILTILVLIMMSCFVCFGCKDDKNPPNEPNKEVFVEGVVEIKLVQIFQLDTTFTCEITAKNTGGEKVVWDTALVVFKMNNTTVLDHDGIKETILPGVSEQIIFDLDPANTGLKEGDSVSVYYKDEFLTNVIVEEF